MCGSPWAPAQQQAWMDPQDHPGQPSRQQQDLAPSISSASSPWLCVLGLPISLSRRSCQSGVSDQESELGMLLKTIIMCKSKNSVSKMTFFSGNTLLRSTLAKDERSLSSPAYVHNSTGKDLEKENRIYLTWNK